MAGSKAVSVIEIKVNDKEFKDFLALLEKYKSQTINLPGAWGSVDKQLSAIEGHLITLVSQTAEISDHLKKAVVQQTKFKKVSQDSVSVLNAMARGAMSLAKHIKDATLSLLKWASVTTLFSGLVGSGGLFGIARLAANTGSLRRESQGIGSSAAELRSSRLHYSKAVDVDSTLQKINDAQHDITKRWVLHANGVSERDISSKSAVDLLPQLIEHARRTGLANKGHEANVPGLTELFDIGTLTRLEKMSKQELEQSNAKYQSDKKSLALSDETQRKWQSLSIQLEKAWVSIDNIFVKKLATLTGPLSSLSDAVVKATKVFLDDVKIEKWINLLSKGISDFSTYISSPSFKSDISSFLATLDQLGGYLWDFGKLIGKISSGFDERSLSLSERRKVEELRKSNPEIAKRAETYLANPNDKKAKENLMQGWGLFNKNKTPSEQRETTLILQSLGITWDKVANTIARSVPITSNIQAFSPKQRALAAISPVAGDKKAFLSSLEKQHGLPANTLYSVWGSESSYGRNKGFSSKGALGDFQFIDKTAKQYGITDRSDFHQGAKGAAQYLKDLLAQFGGDMKKALAAYNWGPGNLRKSIREHGVDWLNNTPPETRKYVAHNMSNINVNVSSAAGSDYVVQANSAAIAQ